jgi:hypothetical protein
MRRILSTALLLGFSLTSIALPAVAAPVQQADTPPDPHGTPQTQPHGTAPSAVGARNGTPTATTHKRHHRKKRTSPVTPAPAAAPAPPPHATPQADHGTPQ